MRKQRFVTILFFTALSVVVTFNSMWNNSTKSAVNTASRHKSNAKVISIATLDATSVASAIELTAFVTPVTLPAPIVPVAPVTIVRVVTAPPVTAPPVTAPPVTAPPVTAPPVPQPLGGVWLELRSCESSNNYGDDTGNGYYGAYQFSLPTWNSLGYAGTPSEAPYYIQDQAAQRLQARSGWSQWPQCSARLGL